MGEREDCGPFVGVEGVVGHQYAQVIDALGLKLVLQILLQVVLGRAVQSVSKTHTKRHTHTDTQSFRLFAKVI